MYTNNRDAYRTYFFRAWQKYLNKYPLEQNESEIIEVIIQHPQYQKMLQPPFKTSDTNFDLEENPFLHMSLHLAIKEQLKTDRPMGIQAIYKKILEKHRSDHEAEHIMMQCLAKFMWEAQTKQTAMSEDIYLNMLKSML